jgi:hypothetical protein
MIATTILLRSQIEFLVELFKADAAAAAVAAVYLSLMSWTLAAQAPAYTCKTMFEGARKHGAGRLSAQWYVSLHSYYRRCGSYECPDSTSRKSGISP